MKQPTSEQLRDPQWWDENAPEGATHYSWWCDKFFLESERGWLIDNEGIEWVDAFFERPTDAKAADWDGKTWPIPVGITVQNWCGEHRYVVAHDRDCIICRCEESDGYRGYTRKEAEHSSLRPLKTQAEREREEVIEAALENALFDCTPGEANMLAGFARRLYDAGLLRKGGDE